MPDTNQSSAEQFSPLAPWCDPEQLKRLANFRQRGQDILGWFKLPATENLLLPIHVTQYTAHVPGGVCEIGVYAGKSLIPLYLMRRKGDQFAVLDLFERNTYPSGLKKDPKLKANRARFEKNMRDWCGNLADLKILQFDSKDLKPDHLVASRLVHIDGHHAEDATRQDILTGYAVLNSQGVILVDDYEATRSWPGVRLAVDAILAEGITDLKLVHVAFNKAVLAREAIADAVAASLEGKLLR